MIEQPERITTGEDLRSVRERLGLSRSALALSLGLSFDAIVSKETGRRPITKRDQLQLLTLIKNR